MKLPRKKNENRKGSILALAVILTMILTLAGFAMLKAAEGRLGQAVRTKSQESAAAAAEAAYEKAVLWMSERVDMLTSLQSGQTTGTLNLALSSADYSVTLAAFFGSRPIYKVSANGRCGIYRKTLNAYVVQAMAGWEMGQCRTPFSLSSTSEVSFMSGEIIDMPLHINAMNDNPDNRDIYISGSPDFRDHISMGESRYTTSGSDKYKSVINLFNEGISFGQPASRIYDSSAISAKVEQFRTTTNSTYRFTPTKTTLAKSSNGKTGFYSATVSDLPAVQLKFYVNNNGQGYVRIYNNCTVAGYTRGKSPFDTWDYKINPDNGTAFTMYPIYGCHYTSGSYTDVRIDNESDPIYVRQSYDGVQSAPGAQIYVDGNVVIGCSSEDASSLGTINTVKGRIAVVATGNIWIANELKVAGTRNADEMPAKDNTNVIGLITEEVIKVVDAGMTTNDLLYDNSSSKFDPTYIANYSPIGNREGTKTYDRQMPYQMVVEAAMTIGGGGWGAENVYRDDHYADRETYYNNKNDKLIVRGSITEAYRGVVGSGNNGYLKQYFYDRRLLTGILPGNIGLKGKYLLVPGGWEESASITSQ